VHRELLANAEAFGALETVASGLLTATGGVPLTRLRLHDVLLWLSGGLRLAHAVALGRQTPEWRRPGPDRVERAVEDGDADGPVQLHGRPSARLPWVAPRFAAPAGYTA
jgi:hypothetical protein